MKAMVKVRSPRVARATFAAQGLGVGEQRLGVQGELGVGRGERRSAAVPHEQRRAELGLQGADLAGQHGLGDMQLLGGPAEVAVPGHGRGSGHRRPGSA